MNTIKRLLTIILLPYAILVCIYNIFQYKKYIGIFHRIINNNDELFDMLNQHGFMPDMIGRLYSPQVISKTFYDFTDDELYDITMRALLPLSKIIERTVLIDVVGIMIDRRDERVYIITITPHNYPIMIKSFWNLGYSIIFNSIIFLTYLLFFN